MKRIFHALLLAALSAAPRIADAQTTGSFDTTVAFGSSQRALSLYVPTTYNAANKYRLLVCLHGLGDSCVTYRNALVTSLGWSTGFPNTIFICPEAESKNADFYSAPGSEAIIQKSIAVAMGKYHIDTADVVLQGFSLGGRAALRYGLDNYATFKGLLLNTPAVQGIKEAVNGRAPVYAFNYTNAVHIPIYMTHGAADLTYTSSLDSTYEQLVRADGKVRYYDFPGLGHAIPPVAQLANVPAFFNASAHAGTDAEAVLFTPSPLLACNIPAPARLLFRNNGQTTLQSVKFKYTLGSQTQSGTWTGSLAPFQHAYFTASFPNVVAGNNLVTITIDSLNGIIADSVAGNNQQTADIHYGSTPLALLDEGFEGSSFPPAGWVLEEGGDFYTAWDADNTVKKTGTNSAGTFNTILFFDNTGRQEGLLTPPVTVPTSAPRLSFDVAYNYHRYTPPYFNVNTDFTDTLEVLVSTNCGASWSSLYKKSGASLATFSTPILNPLTVQADFINPADSNWRREQIDLGALTGGGMPQNARFKFSYRSGLGGSINIDNVRVASATAVDLHSGPAGYRFYPNPVTDVLTIEGGQNTTVTLVNTLGQVVLREQITAPEHSVSTAGLTSGLYLLNITDRMGTTHTARIIKK